MDETKKAQGLLEHVLEEEARAEAAADEISVEESLRERPILSHDSGRTKTRVLFVTNDTAFLNPTDDSLDRFFALNEHFDEIHIMVLRAGTIPTKPVLRVRSNIWVYIASAEYWWWTPVIAHEVTTPQQLVFADGFRADLVVALEPFESAIAARLIARTYKRPWQIHVRRDFRGKDFRKESSRNKWRVWIARYTLKRAYSIRVQTNQIKTSIEKWCKDNATVKQLPRFNNFQSVAETEPDLDVHQTYQQYEKILLYVGALDHQSTLYDALDVMKYVLANPRVGLLVLGDGPMRKSCEKKIKKIGLETQVVFPTQVTNVVSYLKTADVLSVTDEHAVADEIALEGAVAGIPTIMQNTELRKEVFTDGDNAFLCPEEIECYKKRYQQIVHDQAVRQQFRHSLADTVVPQLATDARHYQQRYKNAIETVFVDTAAVTPTED